jgi:formylglycine-generating enzyme required for sulfatase activity
MKSFGDSKRVLRRFEVLGLAVAMIAGAAFQSRCQAGTVTFGTGGNQFSMEFVTIGNPGNAADTTGSPNPAGKVRYSYDIGKFEVSRLMIERYNSEFGVANGLEISLSDAFRYSFRDRDDNVYFLTNSLLPATGVSWNEAARFVNWLNTSTGNVAAYKFTTNGVNDDIDLWTPGDAGYDASNPYRNSLAKYVLPSYNEWYKAAYYDPNTRTYWDFPTGSNTAPNEVSGGTDPNTAVYRNGTAPAPNPETPDTPAETNFAGGLSPYGVMGLGGNVFEWEESSFDLANSNVSTSRGFRGGSWSNRSDYLLSSVRYSSIPSNFSNDIGFRVASVSPSDIVPEPSTLVIGTLFGLGGLLAKRRMKR